MSTEELLNKEKRLYRYLFIINWVLWLCFITVLIGWLALFYNGVPIKVLRWSANFGLDDELQSLVSGIQQLLGYILE